MGSLDDLTDVATMSLYGFEDYHGLDIGVVRAAVYGLPLRQESSHWRLNCSRVTQD
jgi:hypothetical protein